MLNERKKNNLNEHMLISKICTRLIFITFCSNSRNFLFDLPKNTEAKITISMDRLVEELEIVDRKIIKEDNNNAADDHVLVVQTEVTTK